MTCTSADNLPRDGPRLQLSRRGKGQGTPFPRDHAPAETKPPPTGLTSRPRRSGSLFPPADLRKEWIV